jgi:hypothetical protein
MYTPQVGVISIHIYTYDMTPISRMYYVTCIAIIDTIIHHILIIHTNDAYIFDTYIHIHLSVRMMTFLKDSDAIAQRYGVLGIGNLAVSRESHQVGVPIYRRL